MVNLGKSILTVGAILLVPCYLHRMYHCVMTTLPLEIEEAVEHQAVTSLQRAFRKHLNKKATNDAEGIIS
jgi:hypothetical protein